MREQLENIPEIQPGCSNSRSFGCVSKELQSSLRSRSGETALEETPEATSIETLRMSLLQLSCLGEHVKKHIMIL